MKGSDFLFEISGYFEITEVEITRVDSICTKFQDNLSRGSGDTMYTWTGVDMKR